MPVYLPQGRLCKAQTNSKKNTKSYTQRRRDDVMIWSYQPHDKHFSITESTVNSTMFQSVLETNVRQYV